MCAQPFPYFSHAPRGQLSSSVKGVIGLSLCHLNIFWKGGAEEVYVDVYQKCFSDFLSVSEVLYES